MDTIQKVFNGRWLILRIPNFKTEEGAILYKNTVGKLISPRVAEIMLDAINKEIARGDVANIIDLGCGPGTVSIPLAKQHPEVRITALDSSEAMIAESAAAVKANGITNVKLFPMAASSLEVSDGPVDVLFCNLAFPFFARPQESADAVFEAVRPGGRAIFTVPGRHTWNEFFDVAETVMGSAVKMARPFLVKFSQAEVLPGALATAGFADVEVTARKIPFTFSAGSDVLLFFSDLFRLLDYAAPEIQAELASAIDAAYPHEFTMHYEAMVIHATRPS